TGGPRLRRTGQVSLRRRTWPARPARRARSRQARPRTPVTVPAVATPERLACRTLAARAKPFEREKRAHAGPTALARCPQRAQRRLRTIRTPTRRRSRRVGSPCQYVLHGPPTRRLRRL